MEEKALFEVEFDQKKYVMKFIKCAIVIFVVLFTTTGFFAGRIACIDAIEDNESVYMSVDAGIYFAETEEEKVIAYAAAKVWYENSLGKISDGATSEQRSEIKDYITEFETSVGVLDSSTMEELQKVFGDKLAIGNPAAEFAAAFLKTGLIFGLIGIFPIIHAIILKQVTKNNRLIVTDKRIYGVCNSGTGVDVPLNKIVAITKTRNGGITLKTGDRTIKYKGISDADKAYSNIAAVLSSYAKASSEMPLG